MSWRGPKPLTVDWSFVKRELDSLEAADRKRVVANIERFAQHGSGDVTKMVGSDPTEWRLKFKPWRVIFSVSAGGTMHVLSVVQRKDAYR